MTLIRYHPIRDMTVTNFLPTVAGSALLLVASDPTIALWGVLISTIGAIIKQVIDRRREMEQREQRHRYEMEVLQKQTEATMEYRRLTLLALAENTAMTRDTAATAAQTLMASDEAVLQRLHERDMTAIFQPTEPDKTDKNN